ncbi:hypothetical protein AZI86_07300 [Bdellovibrio bacteriovorus]|uniref:Uncharacterized protein n=1 Tax=Bdellovibrio bacteriovorus TaxID=959 RepID=A0A150WQR0_BDEBC|nr:hypothetical protein [Bdellovibrio bacteriovorus]KYG66833.1 hypothetical protein AZI86_07300 [Bdellovibrio bacteriovorus]
MKRLVSNNRGQFLIETVLLMVLTIGLFIGASNFLREKKILSKMIGGPWEKVSGMIEAGVWASPDQARTKHPNQIKRSLTLDPEQL